jgi:hypothetical protein
MAQRVYLVALPTADLDEVCAAIAGSAEARRAVAGRLAERGLAHARRVAASERVASAAEVTHGRPPDAWLYARSCLPYLLAATTADAIGERLDAIGRLESDQDLEAAFEEEVRALGLKPGAPDRRAYQAPDAGALAAWIARTLDQAAELRSVARLAGPDAKVADPRTEVTPRENYAISTWMWLGRIFSRLQPCFWQGRDRWLGDLAGRVAPRLGLWQRLIDRYRRRNVHAWADPATRKKIREVEARVRANKAARTLPGLRELMVSTVDLAPSLGMETEREVLPLEGTGYGATGAVPADRLQALEELIAAARREGRLRYPASDGWAEIVIAAARMARRLGAHLLEADDALGTGYRWPFLSEG